MQFLVEAYIGSGLQRFRLQKDETWRKIESPLSRNYPQYSSNDSYSEQDKLGECLEDIQHYVEQKGMIVLGDNTYEINEHRCFLADMIHRVFMYAKVKRMMRPRQFSCQELRGIIASGEDNHDNRLVLTLDGYFEFLTPEEEIKLSPIAVRYETFCTENGYVGFRAARDDKFIQETYSGMLEGWVTHLMNNELDVYVDYSQGNKTERELWQEVEMLTRHLKKQ